MGPSGTRFHSKSVVNIHMCQNLIKRASTCVHFRKSCGWNMKNKFDWYYFIFVKCVPILYISPWCGGHRLPTSDFCWRGSIPLPAKILFVSKYFYLTRCALCKESPYRFLAQCRFVRKI